MAVADSFHSVWLEIAWVGLVTSVVSNALLSWAQSPERCAPALARDGRVEILHGTCEASESGWARVVRAELADARPHASGDGAYREAPARSPSPSASRVSVEERSRIRKASVIGVAGAAAALLGAAALMRAQPVAMSVFALAAASAAWRLVVNARAAIAALVSALRATTDLGAALRHPPAHAPEVRDVPWIRVSAPGCMGFAFLAIAAFPIAGLLLETAHPVDAHEIGVLVTVHVLFFPLVLAAGVLLRSASVGVDGAQREVFVVRRILGIPYARTSVPLEIVTGFFVEEKREGRGTDTYVVASTTGGPVRLVSGDGAQTAVAALARALEPRA